MKYKITLGKKTYEVEVEKGKAILAAEYDAAAPVAAAPAAAPVAAPAAAAAPAAPKAAPKAAAAPAASGGAAPGTVEAPMPGTVLRVNVNVGDAVKKGQALCVVEAMKMENDIPSPADGTVAEICAPAGTHVDTGSPLIVIK